MECRLAAFLSMKPHDTKRHSATIRQLPVLRIFGVFGMPRICLILATAAGSLGWSTDLLRGGVETEQNFKSVLNSLRQAFPAEGGAGRISYSTVCATHHGDLLPFPKLKIEPPLGKK